MAGKSCGQRSLLGYSPWGCKELDTTERPAEYIMRNAGLEETQARIKIAGRKINNSDMQMTPPLGQKVKN